MYGRPYLLLIHAYLSSAMPVSSSSTLPFSLIGVNPKQTKSSDVMAMRGGGCELLFRIEAGSRTDLFLSLCIDRSPSLISALSFGLCLRGLRRNDPLANGEQGDLELGDAVPAANVSYVRVLALAKPEAGRLIIATIALLIASTSSILIPRFGGTIIDIVSGDLETPEQKSQAMSAVNRTILRIFLIVVVGYGHFKP
ncbi:hypothetical protein SSX86_023966 [Deinandra increscens subsp. villosa]|uniref:Uncharacterized protein n=1 Tax=Deinandra increscens subsp. villosa TaxID=3103831 RepID=A0AAP0CNQ5_9ASTR